MRCEELDDLFEALAEGEPEPPGVRDHVEGCAHCRERLALAREVERLLAVREVPAPPANFTLQVLRRIRQERWRMEQVVDAGFNLAIAAGLLVVVGGLTGLLWSLGWFSIDVAAVATAATTVAPWAADMASQMGTIMLAVVLLSSALALWWWVEGGGEASL